MLKNYKALYGTKNKDNQMQKYTTVFHILDLIQGLVITWQLELTIFAPNKSSFVDLSFQEHLCSTHN